MKTFHFFIPKMNMKITEKFMALIWIPIFFIYWICLTEIWKNDLDERASTRKDPSAGGGGLFGAIFGAIFIAGGFFVTLYYNKLDILHFLLLCASLTSSIASSYICAMKYNTNLYPLYKNATMEMMAQNPYAHKQTHYSFPENFINKTLYGTSFANGKFVTVYWLADRLVYKCDTGSNKIALRGDGMVWAKGPIVDGPILEAVKDLLTRTHSNYTFDQFAALRNSYRYIDGPYFNKYCEPFNYTFFATMIFWTLYTCILGSLRVYEERRKNRESQSQSRPQQPKVQFFKPTFSIETTPEIEGATL
jgi:hypothetical protein